MLLHSLNATFNTPSVVGVTTVLNEHHTGQELLHQLLDVLFVHVHNFVKVLHSVFPK